MIRTLRLRALLAGCMVVAPVLLAPAGVAAAASPSVVATAEGTSATAIAELGACLTDRKAGDLLLLIDSSGSLRQTDPNNLRVNAADYLLSRLATFTDRTKVALNVAVGGFDVDYHPAVPWAPLTSTSLPTFTAGVDAFKTANTGFETDYVNALAGARDALRAQQRTSATPRCQALLWFTDGKFEVDQRTNSLQTSKYGTKKTYAPGDDLSTAAGAAAAQATGATALCRVGGIADQLRSNGVLTFAVGLGSNAGAFATMKSIATGTGCGKAPDHTVGEFRLATDVDGLIFALDLLATPGVTPLEQTTAVCPQAECTHTFVLDGSIRTVHILAGADKPGVDIVLNNPTGKGATRFHFVQGQPAPVVSAAGQTVTASWLSDKTLEINMTRQDNVGWVGAWSLLFVDPPGAPSGAHARSQISITGDLLPALAAPPALFRSGDPATLQLGLVSEASGAAVPASAILGSATISAVLTTADGKQTTIASDEPVAKLAAGSPVNLAGLSPGAATLHLALDVVTAGVKKAGTRAAVPGTRLGTREVDVPLTVTVPLGFPTLGTARVDFGKSDAVGPLKATLTITGPGCAWLAGTTLVTGPDGVKTVTVDSTANSSGSCVTAADGVTTTLPLTLVIDKAGNGTVTGNGTVDLAPAGHPERAISASFSYVADFSKPIDVGRKIAVLIAALVVGIGLPIAFLYLAKRVSARMPGGGLQVARIPVTVTGDRVERNGQPFTFSNDELAFVAVDPKGTRSLTAGDVHLHSRTGISPAGAGYTAATAAGATVVTATGNGRLPLVVQNQWVGLASSPSASEVVVVVLLPATGASDEAITDLSRSVRDHLPGQVDQLRQAAGPGSTPPEPPPPGAWGGGGTPAPRPDTGPSWGGGGTVSDPPASGGSTWGSPPAGPSTQPSPGSWGSPPASGGSTGGTWGAAPDNPDPSPGTWGA